MLSRNAKTYNEEDSLIVEHARILTETLWKFIKYAHAHTHTLTHTNTHTHAHAHAHTPTHIQCTYTHVHTYTCLLYTSPSPRDATLSRMPSSA